MTKREELNQTIQQMFIEFDTKIKEKIDQYFSELAGPASVETDSPELGWRNSELDELKDELLNEIELTPHLDQVMYLLDDADAEVGEENSPSNGG